MSASLTYGQVIGYFNAPFFTNLALSRIWSSVTAYGIAPDGSVYNYATISRTTSGSVTGLMQFSLTVGFQYPVKTVYIQYSSFRPIVIDLDYPVVAIGVNIYTQVGL
jgi:hypothetical protein